jgi:hypothetical protein
MAAAEKDRSRAAPPRGLAGGPVRRPCRRAAQKRGLTPADRAVPPCARAGDATPGARSFGDSVCCEGRARGSGVASADAPFAAPAPCDPRRWLRYSYSILAPACARWPIATAACDPTVHASCCRSQNDCTSVTVAFAADMASIALTLSFGVGWEPPLGSNARMTVSQNAIRKRNRMRCLAPRPSMGPAAADASSKC